MTADLPRKYQARVLDARQLSPTGYELTFERHRMPFQAGRLITLHGPDVTQDRTYTVLSGEGDENLQILYRHIPTGKLTPHLIRLKAGDPIQFSGPYGEFVLRDPARPIVFVATGTGVAPCRSYIRTHPGLHLTLIHGIRWNADCFYRDEFARYRYVPCVTGEAGPGYQGRVTDFFKTFAFEPDSHFYLCGANEMIFDMHTLLKERGVDDSRIFTEAYYYRLHS
jgi:ferredoxin--NADP+ reductase